MNPISGSHKQRTIPHEGFHFLVKSRRIDAHKLARPAIPSVKVSLNGVFFEKFDNSNWIVWKIKGQCVTQCVWRRKRTKKVLCPNVHHLLIDSIHLQFEWNFQLSFGFPLKDFKPNTKPPSYIHLNDFCLVELCQNCRTLI